MKKDIKNDFPIFQAQSGEKPFVFLDNAAVSQMPQTVIDSISTFYSTYKANVHSPLYAIGTQAVEAYEGARHTVAQFLGADADEIIFTSGTTASLNMASRMLEPRIRVGDEIIVSGMEHHSNFVPWQELAKRTGATFTVLPLEEDGTLLLETVRRVVSKRTKIVAITHVSHAMGVINDVREICRIAHEVGAYCVVDAAQSVPHMRVDVRDMNCDFLAFSGQKMLGPTGSGVLYGTRSLLAELDPVVFGGGMIREVDLDRSSWAASPQKFEAGTPHVAGAIGLGEAVRYIEYVGMEHIQKQEQTCARVLRSMLAEIPNVRLYGPRDHADMAGIVSFTVANTHPHDVAEILARENIAVRAGHHCAMPLMKHFNIPGTVRASFYIYNTEDDARRLAEGVAKVIELFHS